MTLLGREVDRIEARLAEIDKKLGAEQSATHKAGCDRDTGRGSDRCPQLF